MSDETDRPDTSGNRWEPVTGPAPEPAPEPAPSWYDAEPAAADDQPEGPRRRLADRLGTMPRGTTRAAAAAATILLVTGVGGAGFALGRATDHHDGFRDGFPGPRDAGFDGPDGGDGGPGGLPGQLPQDPQQGDGQQGSEGRSGTALESAAPTWYVVPWPGQVAA